MAALDRVHIDSVGKRYGSERALANVTLELRSGSMCALLGHNGAGKSTLIGVVSTLVRPSVGSVTYSSAGANIAGAEVRRQIGLLAHASLCYGELSAIENLELVAGLYDLDNPGTAGVRSTPDDPGKSLTMDEGVRSRIDTVGDRAISDLLDQVGLDPRARTRAARTYSRGMVQRLALARALLTHPSLLLLDEPFTGLDRDGAMSLGQQLAAAKQRGTIVVVVTHDLEAIAGAADHVAILRRGKLAFEDRSAHYSYEDLKGLYHRYAS